jgi:hypothetical protein
VPRVCAAETGGAGNGDREMGVGGLGERFWRFWGANLTVWRADLDFLRLVWVDSVWFWAIFEWFRCDFGVIRFFFGFGFGFGMILEWFWSDFFPAVEFIMSFYMCIYGFRLILEHFGAKIDKFRLNGGFLNFFFGENNQKFVIFSLAIAQKHSHPQKQKN